jgi:Mitochondrial small ribosomal subunit Rsm22
MLNTNSISDTKGFRRSPWPETWDLWLWKNLKTHFGLEQNASSYKKIADAVLRMSDYYISNGKTPDSPDKATPWNETWCQIAQLAYYFPLNFCRNSAVIAEGERFGFFANLQSVVDCGAGLGVSAAAFESVAKKWQWQDFEIHPAAHTFRNKLGLQKSADAISEKTDLMIFSYSLTDLLNLKTSDPEALMIIEPATYKDSQKLISTRQELISQGYSIWAPCTHQQVCPLAGKKNDWCHDRIQWQQPEWFAKLEALLPMKNSTLTFSYLLARKTEPENLAEQARLTGDLLREKGKSRQLFCRGPEKEYFAWLSRHGDPTETSRGALIQLPALEDQRAEEWRIAPTEPKLAAFRGPA